MKKLRSLVSRGDVVAEQSFRLLHSGNTIEFMYPDEVDLWFESNSVDARHYNIAYRTKTAVQEDSYQRRELMYGSALISERGDWIEAAHNCPTGRICEIE